MFSKRRLVVPLLAAGLLAGCNAATFHLASKGIELGVQGGIALFQDLAKETSVDDSTEPDAGQGDENLKERRSKS